MTKVLIVEDDPDVQMVARAALKRAGFAVAVAASGPAALDHLASNRPDVILLDWMLPEMDGPDVCERLKAEPATASIPVVFMTARTQGAEIARGTALGAVGYIAKPFDALTLGTQLREILARA